MPLYLSFLNSGDSIPVSPSLDPLPSVCVPASLQALDKALGAQEAAGVAVLADLRDLLVRQPAAGQEAGPVGDAAQQGRGLNQAVVLAGQMGTGARPASGFRTRRAHRVPFDITGGRRQADLISKGL